MSAELITAVASVAVAIAAMIFTTLMLARQVQQMEHERNALAVLEAVERLTDPQLVAVFGRLRGINDRYPTDDDILKRYRGSQDEADLRVVGQFVGIVAVLARRRVIDPSLIADAIGVSLRGYWDTIRVFMTRRRRVENNPFLGENIEWLAMYSAWWKDIPRPRNDENYRPDQFANVQFRV